MWETFRLAPSSHLPSLRHSGQFSPVIPAANTQRFWESRASSLARRINAAAWLARVAPASFFVASAFAVTVYALRRAESPLPFAWIALAFALTLAATGCWWRARRGFFAASDARVLMESHLRLDTRLTAAQLGLVAWPAVPGLLPPVVRWQLRAPAGWLAGAAALIAVAAFAPVPRDAAGGRASGPPPALVQTEAMLTALKEMNVAEPQALEQLQERANELARRPTEEQYSHSALEAADALRNQTVVSCRRSGAWTRFGRQCAAFRQQQRRHEGSRGPAFPRRFPGCATEPFRRTRIFSPIFPRRPPI
jgi:hypothetical protein